MAIDIKVSDGVDSSIASKLLSIANGADSAQKNVDALVKRLQSLDASKLRAVNRAAVDASKVSLNTQREAYYAAREKVELAKLKTEQAKTAAADSARYHQFAVNTQNLATKRSLDAEKVAQARLATAEKSAKVATTNAESMVKQAAANVQAQYQNQLLQYTGNWAKQDNNQRNIKTQTAQAQLGVVQGRQDEVLARTMLAQQRLNTEVARGAKETANAAVSQQRLATEQNRTAASATTAATAQQRLIAAQANASTAVARSNSLIHTYATRLSAIGPAGRQGASGIRDVSSAMAQLDTSASFLRSDGLRWAKVLWALSGATLTAHAIVGAADAYTLLQNRLTVVAEKQEDVNYLTNEMFELANRARQPVAGITKSFTRFDLALKEMGRSQKDTLVLTETVAKALQMSGATAGEAASAMLQLSQAFNKGKLDGDEFRSVMENAPLIAGALAKELGVTRGELLKLAPLGKLTVDQLTKAILNSSESINELFEKFQFTIAQSFEILKNNMTQYFGELDKAIGFTQAISRLVLGLADNLDLLTFAFLAAAPAIGLFVGSKMLAGFGTLLGFLARTGTAIGAIRSPITVVAAGLANLTRQGIATGASLTAMFTAPTTRAIAFQMATVRATAGVLALGAAAGRAGAMMMAAFSFGNIVLVIGTLIAAAIAFGDEIEMAGEKSYTMRDYVISAFTEIWDFTKFAFESIYDIVAEMFGNGAKEGMTFGEKVKSTFEGVVMFGAAMVDSLTYVLKILWTTVKLSMAAVADGVQAIFYVAVNTVVGFVNNIIGHLNTIGSIANSILTATGADAIVGTFGQVGTLAGMEFKSNIQAILADDPFEFKTSAMDAASNFLGRVEDRAKKRNAAASAEGSPRGYDADQAAKFAAANAEKEKKKKEKKPKKSDEERRADIIEKAMNAERKAIAVAQQYGDERERIAAVESVNNKLREKGFAIMSQQEEFALSALVAQRLEAERTGKALQSMYEEVVNPLRERIAGEKALEILMRDGVITTERAANMNARLAETYAAATDKLYDLKKAMQTQYVTQGKFGVDAEIATAIQAAQDSARSRGLSGLTDDDIKNIDFATRKLYDMRKQQEASNSLWEETQGAQLGVSYTMDAVARSYREGGLAVDEYTRKMAALNAQQGALVEKMYGLQDPFEPMRRGLYQLVADMPALGQGMADAISSTLGNAIDNVTNTMTEMILNFDAYAEKAADALGRPVSTLDTMRYALSEIINQIGKELIGAVIKLGIQWAIQAALGKAMQTSMAATAIATQTAAASALNAAWTPAAISASIATMGSAATAGLTGFATAQIAGQAFSKLPTFADGGEIFGAGTSRSDSIVARLSKGEHVVNADAAERNRPLLNAMNSGQEVAMSNIDNSVVVHVTVSNDGSSTMDANGANQFGKNLAGMVKHEVVKQFSQMSRQGHAFYPK